MIADILERLDMLPDHVVASDDPVVLRDIGRPSTTMVVWRRGIPDGLAAMVRRSGGDGFTVMRASGAMEGLADCLADRLGEARLSSDAAALLAPDILGLASRFSAAMNHDLLDIRLEWITGDACRKFHADYVSARLITTYFGRATEWLDRETAALLPEDRNPAGLPIRSLEPGDVALLKGRLWADDHALIHRSPPIAGTGEQRLVLVISPGDGELEGLP